MAKDLFTKNKQKVREMNFKLIERFFNERKGELRYLGLPAGPLSDILQWKDYFYHYSAVERGQLGEEFRYQHELMLTAMKYGISKSFLLLRGDMDNILLNEGDDFGNSVEYPYDVVSLDYSGGLLYKNDLGKAKRPNSIAKLMESQAYLDQDFLLIISTNMDNEDQGEIKAILSYIGRELKKLGVESGNCIDGYISHELDEARLKIFVPYLLNRLASRWYQCEHFKPIYYEGNRNTRMMNFSVWLKRTKNFVAGRPSRQTLVNILNLKAFNCVDGELQETNFGVTELAVKEG